MFKLHCTTTACLKETPKTYIVTSGTSVVELEDSRVCRECADRSALKLKERRFWNVRIRREDPVYAGWPLFFDSEKESDEWVPSA